jgi:hypothetical protein
MDAESLGLKIPFVLVAVYLIFVCCPHRYGELVLGSWIGLVGGMLPASRSKVGIIVDLIKPSMMRALFFCDSWLPAGLARSSDCH